MQYRHLSRSEGVRSTDNLAEQTRKTSRPSLIADRTPQLSLVIPVYNERDNIGPLIDEIEAELADRLRYEIIVVDDASDDGTFEKLADLSDAHDLLRLRSHTENRGQSAAIRSGVIAASAPVVAVIDGDGQNDPADIMGLYGHLCITSDINMVVGERQRRKDKWLRIISSRIANAVRGSLLDDGIKDTGCALKVFYREDFLRLPAFDHMHRFLPALIQCDGGEVHAVPVNHRPRLSGTSKYGVHNRLWVGIVDLCGVMWLKRRAL